MTRRLLLLTFIAFTLTAFGQKHPPAARKQGSPLERLNNMTPEERQRALAKLPPERRQRLEKALERYNRMDPAQRQALEKRYETFRNLPPERQEEARKVFRQFQNLPAERKPELQREFVILRGMNSKERDRRLNSAEIQRNFQPHERKILDQFSDLLPEN